MHSFAILQHLSSRNHLDELRVFSALRGLDTALYRHFPNLDLPHPTERGVVRIEHAVVSPFGIFVIESNDRSGRITGAEDEPEWLQRVGFRRHRFENPLLSSRLRVDALMKFLKLPDPPFIPVIVFTHDCEFENPHKAITRCDSLIHWIHRHRVTMLDSSMVRKAISRLCAHQESVSRKITGKPQLHALHVRQAV